MNTLDRQLLDDLNDLPGWDAFTASSAPTASPESLGRSSTAVREAIASDASRAMSGDLIRARVKPISSVRRRRTRWAVGAVAVAAAAALVIAAPTVSTPGNAPVSVASASEFLTHLASTATAPPGIDDAYWTVKFTSVNPMNPAAGSAETTTRVWYGRTGGQWIATGDGKVIKANDSTALFALPPNVDMSWEQVTRLPSDPTALERALTTIIGPKGSVVDAIGNLLSTAPVNADQRAAMFTILSHRPDVTIRDGVTDTAGRTGTALAFAVGPTVTMTLLLSGDGTLLELTYIAATDRPDAPRPVGAGPGAASTSITKKGDILSRATYLEVGGTNTAPSM